MRRASLGVCYVWALCSCAFTGQEAGRPQEPPALRVEFDSASAVARLYWSPASRRGFLHYEIERALGKIGKFVSLTRLDAVEDTAWADAGLKADLLYRYRVAAHFESQGEVLQSLSGQVVEGGIHCFAAAWDLPAGFLPTRLVVDAQGIVSVVGAGAGRVERFDQDGRPLGSWSFAAGQPACMETGALDAVAVGLDSRGALYVVYNLMEEGRAPRPWWTKFDSRGEKVWTRPLEGFFARHIALDREDRIFIESITQLHQFDTEGKQVAQYSVPSLLVSSLRFWKDRFALLIESPNLTGIHWQAPRLVVYSGPERTTAELVIGRDPLSPEDRNNGVLRRPTDFAVDEVRAFVVNAGQSRIEVFRQHRFLTRWGREGGAEGEFRFAGELPVIDELAGGGMVRRRVVAGGIALGPEGHIYVADTFNNRVQKFQP